MRYLFYVLLLVGPFLFMVAVNESVRHRRGVTSYTALGVTALHDDGRDPETCSWACHNSTSHCTEHHVGLLRPWLPITDRIYGGIIAGLGATGAYTAANVLLFAVGVPLCLWWLAVRAYAMQREIRALKRSR